VDGHEIADRQFAVRRRRHTRRCVRGRRGGVVLSRGAEGWRKELDGGPTGNGNGNDLYGAAVTDDGKRLWFVGASGAIGEYDVESGVLVDRSAPNDVTNNFNDVAVAGNADEADVYVAGDSGSIYYSFENGETHTVVRDSLPPRRVKKRFSRPLPTKDVARSRK
jgi:hypothetical protein